MPLVEGLEYWQSFTGKAGTFLDRSALSGSLVRERVRVGIL